VNRRSWTFRGLLAVWGLAYVLVATVSSADEPLVVQAAKAWDAADLNAAAALYEKALNQGGLYPSDVLVAYSRLGTVQAAMNQTNAAISSFRVAAALDPSFELPSEAGPKARALYKKARADAMTQGGKLEITAEVPTQSSPGSEFVVIAHVREAFVPLIVDVGVSVRDPTVPSMKPWTAKKPVATSVNFEVPGKVVIGGANLLVRVDALDGHGNRWASSEARVKVDHKGEAAAPLVGPGPGEGEGEAAKPEPSKGGGFWSSAWPWVIGGAIVAGSVATYFATRPTPDVTIAAPQWRP
jgi:hypothetical protein